MDSIAVEHISKCYRLGKGALTSAWPQPWRRAFRRGKTGAEQPKAREVWALKDVSFSVQPGTVLGVIGPNGAGKTTLLKVLGRVTLPTEGRAVVRGRVVSLLEVGGGFQPDLTGRENIFLHAALYGIPRSQCLLRLGDIVEFAELADFIDTPVKKYSSGMYLRLAFSVAVNMEPDILLADEVLAVGDVAFQERCMQRIEDVGAEGMTVLFVSHDMAAISRLCHRVIWLNAGEIVKDGEPDAVVTDYESSAWTLIGRGLKQGKKGGRNAYGELLSVRLASTEGREIGAVRVSEDIILKVKFTVVKPGVNARCVFDVFTSGIHVFRSAHPEATLIPEPGIYVGTIRIPAHFLSETIYTLDVRVRLATGDEDPTLPLEERNALAFRVYDTDASLSARGTYKKQLPGVVTPKFEWSLTRERELVKVRA